MSFLKQFKDTSKKLLCPTGRHHLPHSVAIILLLSVFIIIMQFFVQGMNCTQFHPLIFLANAFPVFALMCLLYFVIGKIHISYMVTCAFTAILLCVNHYKIAFRDAPLNYADFSLIKETDNIIKGYTLNLDAPVLGAIIFTVISALVVFLSVKNKLPGIKARLLGVVVLVVLIAAANRGFYSDTELFTSIVQETYHESIDVSRKGLVYSLSVSYNTSGYHAPLGYSEKKAKKIIEAYGDGGKIDQPVNVIAVMCEAYADIQEWGNVTFKDNNPYEFYNHLKTQGAYGKLFVPHIAGGTASSEFEFLTGNNISSINKAMPEPYKAIINRDIYSIARVFSENGYKTVAMHPGFPWFYNRQTVYDFMGFDRFISKDDLLPGSYDESKYYVGDDVTARLIIDDFKKHLAENPDAGYFNFTVTIENHGPYSSDILVGEQEFISKATGFNDEQYNIINNYLTGISNADNLMKEIYQFINTVDSPTVMLMFGDHLPYLDSQEEIFEILGLDISYDSYKAYENRYKTDYVIVGNNAFNQKYTPSIYGEQPLITSNYLATKLFKFINMELPPIHALSDEMCKLAPIISKKHIGTGADYKEALNPEFDKLFEEFKILQYYNLKDYSAKENDKGERQ